MFQYVLGTATFTSGVVLLALGTDYGRVFDLSVLSLLGCVMVFLGTARLKYAWMESVNKKK